MYWFQCSALIQHLSYQVLKRQAHQGLNAVGNYIDTDLLALLHSMKLLVQPQGDNGTLAEYTATKQIFSLVESQGTVSLRLLQAVLLFFFLQDGKWDLPSRLSVGRQLRRAGACHGDSRSQKCASDDSTTQYVCYK